MARRKKMDALGLPVGAEATVEEIAHQARMIVSREMRRLEQSCKGKKGTDQHQLKPEDRKYFLALCDLNLKMKRDLDEQRRRDEDAAARVPIEEVEEFLRRRLEQVAQSRAIQVPRFLGTDGVEVIDIPTEPPLGLPIIVDGERDN